MKIILYRNIDAARLEIEQKREECIQECVRRMKIAIAYELRRKAYNKPLRITDPILRTVFRRLVDSYESAHNRNYATLSYYIPTIVRWAIRTKYNDGRISFLRALKNAKYYPSLQRTNVPFTGLPVGG